jgi:hypothetical protein
MGEERRLTCSRRGGIDGREEEYPYGKQARKPLNAKGRTDDEASNREGNASEQGDAVIAVMVSRELLLSLDGTGRQAEATFLEDTEAKRRAEEDAAINAESVLEQTEEANALDPVG